MARGAGQPATDPLASPAAPYTLVTATESPERKLTDRMGNSAGKGGHLSLTPVEGQKLTSQIREGEPGDFILLPRQDFPDHASIEIISNTQGRNGNTVMLKNEGFIGTIDFTERDGETRIEGFLQNRQQINRSFLFRGTTAAPIIRKATGHEILCMGIPLADDWDKSTFQEKASAIANAPAPFNSKPGAPTVIYLDFDGQVVNPGNNNATPWNGGNEINAVSPNFSDAKIADICRWVAEDFSPWNVTVTNQESVFDAVAPRERLRVIFTSTNTAAPGSGGVAYLFSFDNNADNPCWVFNLGNKSAPETASHEIGHTLGLRHDGRTSPSEEYYGGHGSGTTGWGPIMGAVFSKTIAHWSKGEYLNASNTEDDLAIIASHLRGANAASGYRDDQAGDNIGTASPMNITAGTNASGSGIIERTADIDIYVFTTGAGTISFNIEPDPDEPNLDIRADLLDSAGNVVATSNPVDALNASLSYPATAGAYYLSIQGVGKGDPLGTGYTDYSSIGQYSFTGTIIDSGGLTPPPTAVLSSIDDTTLGTSIHTFAITYQVSTASPATRILRASLGDSDVEVGTPSGGTIPAILLSTTPLSGDASPITATYQISAPGGTWDSADGGIYSVRLRESEVEDDNNIFVSAGILGTFESDGEAPSATLTGLQNPLVGDADFRFEVSYTDANAVDVSTLGTNDIRVTGPNGYQQIATFVGVDVNSDGSPRVATYRIVPPSTTWTLADSGTYTITLQSGQVADTGGNQSPSGELGTFKLLVPLWTQTNDTDPGWSFETGWAWGQPQGTGGDPSGGYTGDNVIGYNLAGQYTNNINDRRHATSPDISTLGYADLTFTFRRWLGIENNQWDFAGIEYSTDGGGQWTSLWSNPSTTINESSWSEQTYALPASADNIQNLRLRFYLGTTDGSVTYSGWNIDDLSLLGAPLPNQPPILTLDSPTSDDIRVPGEVGLILETSALDDRTAPASLDYAWSRLSGPGVASFEDATAPDTAVTFDQDGTYVLELAVSDPEATSRLTLTVEVGATDSSPGVPPTSSGVVHLKFDETGGSIAADSFPGIEINNGTLTGSPTWAVAGVRGTALGFDGTNDRVSLADSNSINLGSHQKRTVALWFKPDTLSGRQLLYEEGGTTRGMNIYLEGSTLYVGGWNNNENNWNQTWLQQDVSSTAWQHVAFVLDAPSSGASTTAFKMYHNGAWVASGDGATINQHTDNIAIGARDGSTKMHDGNATSDHHFSGAVDDFLLYSRALTEAEISNLAGQNIGPVVTVQPTITTTESPFTLTPAVTDDGVPGPVTTRWEDLGGDGLGITGNTITFPAFGDYKLRLIAGDGAIQTFNDQAITYQDTPANFYSNWIESYTSYSDPEADSDGDGVPNLIEYATGGSPTGGTTNPAVQTITEEASQKYLNLVVTQRKDAAARGLTYVVEKSTDLGGWSTEDISSSPPVSIDAEFESVTYRLTLPIDETNSKCFLRCRIQLGN